MQAHYLSIALIPLALALDFAAGDPPLPAHPVRLMGWSANRLEPVFRNMKFSPETAGALFAAGLVGGTFLFVLALAAIASLLHPLLGLFIQVLILYTCLAPRCLYDEAMKVRRALADKNIEKARTRISMLVSRDVKNLDETGITRAAVETVAENFVDGVLSPMFYAAILGAPGAAAFKMASTLDSMVGYKNEYYLSFGKASARLDDFLNWLPARLSVPIISLTALLMTNTGKRAFETARLEGNKSESPNAGLPEASFAGALGVKIGGPGVYHGRLIEKPFIGGDFPPPSASDIEKAADLMLLAALVCAVPMTGIFFLIFF